MSDYNFKRNKGKAFDLKSDEARLNVSAHRSSDVDVDELSLHHTLGKGPFQAAKGTHTHEFEMGGRSYTLQELFEAYITDTGWIPVPLVTATYVEVSAAEAVKIRKVGKVVTIRGKVKPIVGTYVSDTLVTIADTGAMPAEFIKCDGLTSRLSLGATDTNTQQSRNNFRLEGDANAGRIQVQPSHAATYVWVNDSWMVT